MNGIARWWAGLGAAQRVVAAVVAVFVLVNLTLAGTRSLVGGDPGGPVSSSFSTGDGGLEAYADLLTRSGRSVERRRTSLADAPIDPRATAVVADPTELAPDDLDTLSTFLAGGGRLVVTGESSSPLVAALTGSELSWDRFDTGDLRVWAPADGTGGARELAGDDGGRWIGAGPTLVPVAGAGGAPVLVVAGVGEGRLLALADTSVLQNRALGRSDNAALALGLAGPSARPVVFVESVHGFGRTGLAAVPSNWKWAGAGVALAVLVGLWAAGSRFGPPEPAVRRLRPPRRDHVDAVAAGLDRVARDPAAAAWPLAERRRAELAGDLGTPADASSGVLYAAAERAGVDPAEVALAVDPVLDLPGALRVGAAVARRARQRTAGSPSAPPASSTTLTASDPFDRPREPRP